MDVHDQINALMGEIAKEVDGQRRDTATFLENLQQGRPVDEIGRRLEQRRLLLVELEARRCRLMRQAYPSL